ncbi:enolase C-terminal domain-like protein [Streptomyces sp. NPDC101234]|uniref:enolase C-terminal domain-like protein n=1 Tax=Streptomyces sp. NPDC101234 TaxID=3366138 RepID=UPI0038124B92
MAGAPLPFSGSPPSPDHKGRALAPHFVMEIHVHLSAACPRTAWVEPFEWLEPMFNERLEVKDGRMIIPNRAGLGLSLSEQAGAWTKESMIFGPTS